MAHPTGNWSVGKYSSVVVSDQKIKNNNFPCPPNQPESSEDELNHYGGYLVCESVGNSSHARLIAAAPDLYKACNDALMLLEPLISNPASDLFIRQLRDALTKANPSFSQPLPL